jgi:hypothetical protein
MRLVMLIEWGDEYSGYGTDTIPFEYESKEDFEFDYLTFSENHKEKFEKFTTWQQSIIPKDNHKDKFEKYAEIWRSEFEERAKDGANLPYFKFAGREFSCMGECPKVLTLEEWFENYKER